MLVSTSSAFNRVPGSNCLRSFPQTNVSARSTSASSVRTYNAMAAFATSVVFARSVTADPAGGHTSRQRLAPPALCSCSSVNFGAAETASSRDEVKMPTVRRAIAGRAQRLTKSNDHKYGHAHRRVRNQRSAEHRPPCGRRKNCAPTRLIRLCPPIIERFGKLAAALRKQQTRGVMSESAG